MCLLEGGNNAGHAAKPGVSGLRLHSLWFCPWEGQLSSLQDEARDCHLDFDKLLVARGPASSHQSHLGLLSPSCVLFSLFRGMAGGRDIETSGVISTATPPSEATPTLENGVN